jgi:acetyl-CoA C-acetyltransferase
MPYVASICTCREAEQAFSIAGTTPVDIDVAEVHDFFTDVQSIGYEDLGCAERSAADKLLKAGVTTIGGPTAVSAVTILEGPGTDGR